MSNEAKPYRHVDRIAELEAENERLRDVLERFREFVQHRATQWDTSDGPCNHHNPIWLEIAEALAMREANASAV